MVVNWLVGFEKADAAVMGKIWVQQAQEVHESYRLKGKRDQQEVVHRKKVHWAVLVATFAFAEANSVVEFHQKKREPDLKMSWNFGLC